MTRTSIIPPERTYLKRYEVMRTLDLSDAEMDNLVAEDMPSEAVEINGVPHWNQADLEEAISRPLIRRKGTIYVVGFALYVKIGFTTGPLEYRLPALQVGCPERIEVLATHVGKIELERSLHRRFASQRSYGEWFRRVGKLAEWIEVGCPI